MKLRFLLVAALLLGARGAGAQMNMGIAGPVAASNGGNGDTLGKKPGQNTDIVAAAGTTTAALLVKGVYAANPNGTTVQTSSAATDYIQGVALSSQAAGANVVIQSWGPANCTFDNQTVVGDTVTLTGAAGQCHDTGSTASPEPTTQMLGYVRSLNSGAGTAASVDFTIGMGNGNGCTVVKCIAGAIATCGKGTGNWTQICTATLGPFMHRSGPGNVVIGIRGQAVLFELGTEAGNTMPTATTLRVMANNCNGGTNADAHGYSSLIYAGTGPQYIYVPVLGEVTLNAKDALYPSACSVELDCAEGSTDTTGAFKVYSGSTDSNGANTSSSVEFMACPGNLP